MPSATGTPYGLPDLLRVMARLRDPESGCPWDLEQDFQSIVPSTLEECYELAQAIEQEDYPHVAEELGDVLFQVVFYSQLGSELDLFSFESVIDTLVTKLIRRHPHVFADGEIEGVVRGGSTVEAVKTSWETIKQQERNDKSQGGVLADVPVALPALPRAQKLQKRASRVNFDWPDAISVLTKLEEEIAELRQAIASGERAKLEEETGDVLFTCVNIARHLGVDAETSLRRANSKFESRFQHMEANARAIGRALVDMSDDELDAMWLTAKALDARRE
ncbi:MAG: nucleoside triphosphate pyrophosphohydrolase [Pseudomonadota bacterium]